MRVPYSYLQRQFSEINGYIDDIRALVRSGDFTLGTAVTQFEERFAQLCELPYAVGVGSGTDALILSLKALGIGHGDEVITTSNTFIATVGAIAMTGARPVFVDNNDEYTIDVQKIETAITPNTKAIVPVHLTGNPADMSTIMEIAQKHNLVVVEDAAQAILAAIDGRHVGSWGETACFSLHPLKNLNIWGDGGVIVTRSEDLYKRLRLIRNHGLSTRDEVVMFGHNSRLDTLQALVANRLIGEVNLITNTRIGNARKFDESFADLSEYIVLPPRKPNVKQVYHTYVIRSIYRDGLMKYLIDNGIRAKIHYPIPVHLQKAAAYLGYKLGDFPVCEQHCNEVITLPVHQHLSSDEIDYIVDCVHAYFRS
ncbi:MAG: DegT/DnrJ/EryC1/StrS family aminotransferase [Chloroflexi bacterium]|nr:DegT/DnrJ/EryC1/StrS family aminotransferase [Chloroflexota bacterium]